MKKYMLLLLSVVMTLTVLTGCRRKTDGTPGDPTVNNSTDAATVPSTSSRATRPSTEPTMHTTTPDTTMGSDNDFTDGSDSTEDATMDSAGRRRERVLPRR